MASSWLVETTNYGGGWLAREKTPALGPRSGYRSRFGRGSCSAIQVLAPVARYEREPLRTGRYAVPGWLRSHRITGSGCWPSGVNAIWDCFRLRRSRKLRLKLRHASGVTSRLQSLDDEAVNEGAERVELETIDQPSNTGARSTGLDERVRDAVEAFCGFTDEGEDSSKGAFAAPSMTAWNTAWNSSS